jgi:ABC-type glycerol-3-phosphate transport system permease component
VGVGAASSVILMLPPVLLFVFTQTNIIDTMATSGMKD